ncbi:hypothetical protein [Nocardia aurantiaca]|uniref:Uncharacterized protein n=1 Tax=Nocardia aurantiaca TaxID=2675850 RepID=A0A6I3L767_9NOCA|nr:hypothetical protein [Nocardia aurantiaca]MTE16276.1 hypothetical protein [Nocardia aurantiaca]
MQFERVAVGDWLRTQLGELCGQRGSGGGVGDGRGQRVEIVWISIVGFDSDAVCEFVDAGVEFGGFAIGGDPVGVCVAGGEQVGALFVAAGAQPVEMALKACRWRPVPQW